MTSIHLCVLVIKLKEYSIRCGEENRIYLTQIRVNTTISYAVIIHPIRAQNILKYSFDFLLKSSVSRYFKENKKSQSKSDLPCV